MASTGLSGGRRGVGQGSIARCHERSGWVSSARPVGLGVGFFVGFGVGAGGRLDRLGLGDLGLGFGLAVALGFGFTEPHLSAKMTVHIFLPFDALVGADADRRPSSCRGCSSGARRNS